MEEFPTSPRKKKEGSWHQKGEGDIAGRQNLKKKKKDTAGRCDDEKRKREVGKTGFSRKEKKGEVPRSIFLAVSGAMGTMVANPLGGEETPRPWAG